MVNFPDAFPPAKSTTTDTGPCVMLILRTISVPFSNDTVWTAGPCGVSMVCATLQPPPSSFTTSEMPSGISCPPMAILAWYLNVPGFRSTAGLGTPTTAASTFLESVTVLGSTVISERRFTTSGVPSAW